MKRPRFWGDPLWWVKRKDSDAYMKRLLGLSMTTDTDASRVLVEGKRAQVKLIRLARLARTGFFADLKGLHL